jgi:hypothetical protein
MAAGLGETVTMIAVSTHGLRKRISS